MAVGGIFLAGAIGMANAAPELAATFNDYARHIQQGETAWADLDAATFAAQMQDRNGVTTTTSSYDYLDRMLERYVVGAQWQNYSGTEYFEYNARGLTNYTDALGKAAGLAKM